MTTRGSRQREREAAEAARLAESERRERIDAELEEDRQRVEDAIQRSADLDADADRQAADRGEQESQVQALIADARARAQEMRGIWQRQTREIWLVRRARAERLERSRREKPVPVFTAPPRTASIISMVMFPLIAVGSFLGSVRNHSIPKEEISIRPVHTKDNVPITNEKITHKERESIIRSPEFALLSEKRSKELFGGPRVLSFVSQAFREQGGDRTEAALDAVSPLLVLALAEPATSSRARALYAAAVVGGANPTFAAELALPALLEDAADEAERALARSLDPSIRPDDPEPDDESESGGGGCEPPPVMP